MPFRERSAVEERIAMLRDYETGAFTVGEVCRRYGVSRQTFYNFKDRFEREGTAGLLWRKPGPQGPSKITAEVVSFVDKRIQRRDELTAEQIGSELKKELGVVLHMRTIEKLVKEIRSKKNS